MKTYLYSLCILAMCAIFSVSCNDKQTNVTGVTLDKSTLSLSVGGKDSLKATVMPDNADNKNVVWSSDKPEIATVDKGVVTAVTVGTATITVKTEDGNKTATCKVTVANIAVTGVTLDQPTLSLVVGTDKTLKATVAPDNAANKNLTWTSSAVGVATVDNTGKVTAVTVGTATITVKTEDGNKTATCAVTVTATAVAVTGVTLTPATLSLAVGATGTLTKTIAPATATNTNVTWTSDKPEFATVDNTGKVTAVAVGTATITVKTEDGNKTATCAVTVKPVAVTGVTLDQPTLSLVVGTDKTLVATVAPDNAANKNLTWSSSAVDVATVDNTGKVTAVAVGTATITVTTVDGNKTATCAVTVTGAAVAVTGVTLTPETLSLAVGATGTLTKTIAPEGATNTNVTWSSSAEGVATVADGTVTAVAEGTATITVTTEDGGKTATCAVTVTPADIAFFNGLSTDATWDSYPTTSTNCTFTMIETKLPLSTAIKMEGANSSLHFSWKTAWISGANDGWDAKVPFDNNWTPQDISTKTHLVIQLYVGEESIYKLSMPYIQLQNGSAESNRLLLGDYVEQALIDDNDKFNYIGWYKIVIPIADFGTLPEGGIKVIAFGNWNADDTQHDLYIGYLAFTKP